MNDESDRIEYDPRRFEPRIEVDAAVLALIDGEPWCTQLGDISANGCRVLRVAGMAVELNQFVRIFLLTENARAVSFCGRISRIANQHFGVSFQTEEDSQRFDPHPDRIKTSGTD